jgi:hypothetical protein
MLAGEFTGPRTEGEVQPGVLGELNFVPGNARRAGS